MPSAALALLLQLSSLPPLPPFPNEVRPRSGTTAPSNAAVFALGEPAPSVSQVGIAATVDGVIADVGALEAIGCCAIVAPLADVPPEGAAVQVTITSPNGDALTSWTVGPADTSPPAFSQDAQVIDHGPVGDGYVLVIAPAVSDDTQVGAVLAYDGDVLVGVAADGTVVSARLPRVPPSAGDSQACVDLVAVDVARNESPRATVCVTPAAEGEGEGEGDGGEPSGCAAPAGAPALVALLCIARVRYARRRAR